MPGRHWTPDEEALLRELYATTRTADLCQQFGGSSVARISAKANAIGLRKTPELLSAMARERTTAPGHASQRHRWAPGSQPWNTGLTGVVGTHPATRACQFRPGNRPHTWVPIGSFRIVADDMVLEQKFSDAKGSPRARWRSYAAIVWEREHGPIPADHIVVFRPGMKTFEPDEITADKLECITRAQNMARNTFRRHGPEVARLVQLRGVLSRAINQRLREEETTE